MLVGTGIFFTIYLGFPQFRFFGKAWKLVSRKNNKSDADGETTGFEALTTAMSGAVGTGNIGGVALSYMDRWSSSYFLDVDNSNFWNDYKIC